MIEFLDTVRVRLVRYYPQSNQTFVDENNGWFPRPHLTLDFLIENEYFKTNDTNVNAIRQCKKNITKTFYSTQESDCLKSNGTGIDFSQKETNIYVDILKEIGMRQGLYT